MIVLLGMVDVVVFDLLTCVVFLFDFFFRDGGGFMGWFDSHFSFYRFLFAPVHSHCGGVHCCAPFLLSHLNVDCVRPIFLDRQSILAEQVPICSRIEVYAHAFEVCCAVQLVLDVDMVRV